MIMEAIFSALVAMSGAAESMKEMPKIEPKSSIVVKTKEEGEALQKARGFGAREPKVRMMNLMMVEGSGLEGMDMAKPHDPSLEESHEHHHHDH